MYSIIFIYVSLIGNGTSKKKSSNKNSSNLRNIGRGGGGHTFSWPRIFKVEVVFCFIF